MKDELTVREQKVAAEDRIKAAIVQLKRQFVDRSKLTVLDKFLVITVPGRAYADTSTTLSFVPDMHRNQTHLGAKWAVLIYDLARLLMAYWEFIRSDESQSLSQRLWRVEDYAKYGLDQCDLLGDVEHGFYLFNKAAQQEEDPCHEDKKPAPSAE